MQTFSAGHENSTGPSLKWISYVPTSPGRKKQVVASHKNGMSCENN